MFSFGSRNTCVRDETEKRGTRNRRTYVNGRDWEEKHSVKGFKSFVKYNESCAPQAFPQPKLHLNFPRPFFTKIDMRKRDNLNPLYSFILYLFINILNHLKLKPWFLIINCFFIFF